MNALEGDTGFEMLYALYYFIINIFFSLYKCDEKVVIIMYLEALFI